MVIINNHCWPSIDLAGKTELKIELNWSSMKFNQEMAQIRPTAQLNWVHTQCHHHVHYYDHLDHHDHDHHDYDHYDHNHHKHDQHDQHTTYSMKKWCRPSIEITSVTSHRHRHLIFTIKSIFLPLWSCYLPIGYIFIMVSKLNLLVCLTFLHCAFWTFLHCAFWTFLHCAFWIVLSSSQHH